MSETIDQSILQSLDADNQALLGFFPYIFQDVNELGTCSKKIACILEPRIKSRTAMRVLDLGCGKGSTCLYLASKYACECLGVDGLHAFILEAKQKAREQNLRHLCRFEVNDVRKLVDDQYHFDVVILGGLGPVFGDYELTFEAVSKFLRTGGLLVLDEVYSIDEPSTDDDVLSKREIVEPAKAKGLLLCDEIQLSAMELVADNQQLLTHIRTRCDELKEKYPADRAIFEQYVCSQEIENNCLEKHLVSSIMLFEKSA
ncbi:MAG: class I SAM-dependent methyltransferase [Gammaproteobacteria bacterium]|nr:class I SAM-dependent methyltransferase [Gammaproteobacteria bacterium]